MLLILSIRSLADQAILLPKNSPAPYVGILMPVNYAKQLEKNTLDLALYKSEVQKHEGAIPLYTAPDSSVIILVGVGGLLTGYLIGTLVH